MAWYKTGTISVTNGSAVITGTNTAWLDNKQSVGVGNAILIPGAGQLQAYEILSVDSNTQIRLTSPYTGATASGVTYSVMTFYVDSVPDFARRLAAQLSYYQSQMDGWQQLLTSTGAVSLVAPDGTNVNMSSVPKLTTDVAGKIGKTSAALTNASSAPETGLFSVTATFANCPIAAAGELLHIQVSATTAIQQYHAIASNRRWQRSMTAASTWTGWVEMLSSGTVAPVTAGGTGVQSLGGLLTALGAAFYSPSANLMSIRIPYPNGTGVGSVLIQAASVVVTTNSNADTTISYPLAFTKVFTILTSNGDNANQAGGDGMVSVINFAATRTTNFDINVQNRRSASVRVNFIAIGA